MFLLKERLNIQYYQSTLLKSDNLRHAFTTRIGGNIHNPLNGFSLGTAGNPLLRPYVNENRIMICEILDLDQNLIISPDQQHTDNIKVVSSIDDDISATDGVITATPGLVLMLLFADCTPIIIYAPEERVVGVIHAGWRGTAKKITSKAIKLMETEFNIKAEDIQVAIGASIGKCCYSVSSEIAGELSNTIKVGHDDIFRKKAYLSDVNVDLGKLNMQQLLEAGVVNIDRLDDCTSCKNSLFYSYRVEKEHTGRHSAIASLI